MSTSSSLLALTTERVDWTWLAIVWTVAAVLLLRALVVFVLNRWPRRGLRARFSLRRSRPAPALTAAHAAETRLGTGRTRRAA